MRRPLLLAALALACFAAAPLQAAGQQRSVILIVVDSLRADHLATYGYRRATTPEINRFAQTSAVFTNAYSTSTWTPPSIMSILTGEYSWELNSNPRGDIPLTNGHRTIATLLASYGYETAGFYNTPYQLSPEAANVGGFDRWTDYGTSAPAAPAFVARGIDLALEALRSTTKPVFLFLHVLDPHNPYTPERNHFGRTPPDRFPSPVDWILPDAVYSVGKVSRCQLTKDPALIPQMMELYDSEILEADRELGRLLRFLESDRRYRDALVILTGDHGEEFGEHGGLYHGARFFEETVRVPLIIRDPLRPSSAGRRVGSTTSHVDLLPTILQAVGIPFQPADYSGRSLVEFLARRGGAPRSTVFIEKTACGYDAVGAVRMGDWKLIVGIDEPRVELYDLRNDPGETRDLSHDRSQAARNARERLLEAYATWRRHVTRPLDSRNGADPKGITPEMRRRLEALGYIHGHIR
jgi:arylsulfatase A-like enzyme